jgi:transcriptional regulator with XRE-family HTH domain
MESLKNLVGKKIRIIRKAKSLTQEALAEKAGLHFSYIGGLERGERNVSLDSLEKIIMALDMSAEEFFDFQIRSKSTSKKQQVIDEINQVLKVRDIKELKMIQSLSKNLFDIVDSYK